MSQRKRNKKAVQMNKEARARRLFDKYKDSPAGKATMDLALKGATNSDLVRKMREDMFMTAPSMSLLEE